MLARLRTSILLLSALPGAISVAHADCRERPGTPNELRVEQVGYGPNPTLRLSWRNTTTGCQQAWQYEPGRHAALHVFRHHGSR